ncbi:PREDICTED: amiloride-sensitive amine oxidase [copper-containing] [Myotis brandtii]|uniref:amiloride-sensitive amine oxidase [copper-containing] n=1 Tax=Myotis brandtii TaxID=109478 RepID=UPI000704365C|nr:PREDICTED: amiloride-sensitive amine oxidase [copper-containing] [Myotis brandtii]
MTGRGGKRGLECGAKRNEDPKGPESQGQPPGGEVKARPALGWAMAAILMLQTLAMANHSPRTLRSQATVFADLSTEELKAVRSFLWSRKDLRLEPSRGSTIAKNTVFLIEMLLPRKQQVLKFLDHGQRRPVREARAVIFFGAQDHPNITEFAVGPLPWPHYLRPLPPRPGHQVSWNSRPISSAEYVLLSHTLQEATRPLHQFFLDTTGFSFQDCHTRCLTFTDVAPRGLASGERRTWFILERFVEGFFLHPTGLELLLDHSSMNAQDWAVEQVWYNGKFYRSPEELARKYDAGEVDVVVLEDPIPEGKGAKGTEEPPLFSSYKPRGHFPSPMTVKGPHLVQPQGPRYRLEGNAVLYGGWSFAFRLRSSTGLQVLNVHFGGERIAYEVSVQEAVALYGGHTPAGMQTKYIDVGWGLGTVTHELAPGIDCPGTKNSFQTLGMKLENITNPWSPEHRLVQPTLKQTGYSRERQAAFRFGQNLPKYLLFTSPKENRWGHQRSYRLQIHSMAEQVMPPGWQEERAVTWARYPLAVTKYRESELCSSSIYNQNDPWDPPVVFEEFLRNNENIEEEDLVAWVTVGFLHIPHSEDIPNMATPGNSVGFLLRPFNFFPEDPSMASRDTVIVWPRDKGPNYVQRWIPEEGGDCWKPTPFSYNGTYRPV